MGNKTGKFNVPSSENGNLNEQAAGDAANKIDSSNAVEVNGNHLNNEIDETTENGTETKKKNFVSWLKKVSMRKEKKPRESNENGSNNENIEVPKENGVKEELVAETIKENGDNEEIHSEKVENVENDSQNVIEECEHKDEITNQIVSENMESEITETLVEGQ